MQSKINKKQRISIKKITTNKRTLKKYNITPRSNLRKDAAKKSKHSKTNKKQKRSQRGGIIVEKSTKEDLFEFISNSNVKYLNKGANGIIFIAELRKTSKYQSKYLHIGIDNYGEPVLKIIIKLVEIWPDIPIDPENEETHYLADSIRYPLEYFKNEVKIQSEVFKKTSKYLQPICPAVIFYDIIKPADRAELKKKICNPTCFFSIESDAKEQYNNLFTNVNSSIGIIAMEYAGDAYNSLYELWTDRYLKVESKKRYYLYGLFIILKMALETGYSHADFHPGNLLINSKADYFMKDSNVRFLENVPLIPNDGPSGEPYILDFGYTNKIPFKSLEVIKSLCKDGQYVDALKEICKVPRSDESDLRQQGWISFYGWVCGNFSHQDNPYKIYAIRDESKIDELIGKLFESREKFVDNLKTTFNEKNATEASKYPVLPLTDEITDKFYSSMINRFIINPDVLVKAKKMLKPISGSLAKEDEFNEDYAPEPNDVVQETYSNVDVSPAYTPPPPPPPIFSPPIKKMRNRPRSDAFY